MELCLKNYVSALNSIVSFANNRMRVAYVCNCVCDVIVECDRRCREL